MDESTSPMNGGEWLHVKRSAICIVALIVVAGCASGPSPSVPTSALPNPTVASAVAVPTLEARLDQLLGADLNGAALVAKDGEILYAKGFGMADAASNRANTPGTRFRLGSITKQFTAMAILILESRGLLERSDSICDYIDDCPEAWKVVTIEHLLGHTSGIADFTDQPDFDILKALTPAQTVARVSDIPLTGEPGESFSYTNTGYVLLGMAIEKVSGNPYATYLQDEIFGPLRMQDSGYEDADTPGLATGYSSDFNVADPLDMSVPYAAGGLYSTVLDLNRWQEALYTERLAPAMDIARYFTPLVEVADGVGYAYGQVVGDDDGSTVVQHAGGINGFSTYLARYPDDHITVALLTNRQASPDLEPLAMTAAQLARENP